MDMFTKMYLLNQNNLLKKNSISTLVHFYLDLIIFRIIIIPKQIIN